MGKGIIHKTALFVVWNVLIGPAGMQPKFDCVRAVIYNASINSECVFHRSSYYKVVHGHAACLERQKCKDGLYLKKCNID